VAAKKARLSPIMTISIAVVLPAEALHGASGCRCAAFGLKARAGSRIGHAWIIGRGAYPFEKTGRASK
jgi:hypothetical protein